MAENANISTPLEQDVTERRKGILKWDDYFMAVAFVSAKRSKDPRTQVGACIVNQNKRIVGVGYNGMPNRCGDAEFPWQKNPNKLESKSLYVVHAEVNAILNKNASDLQKCSIYVGLFPCNECAKMIIQSGIEEVIYKSDKYSGKPKTIASKRMFNAASVAYRQYIPNLKKIVIDFDEID